MSKPTALDEMKKALMCLRLEAAPAVMEDVDRRFAALVREGIPGFDERERQILICGLASAALRINNPATVDACEKLAAKIAFFGQTLFRRVMTSPKMNPECTVFLGDSVDSLRCWPEEEANGGGLILPRVVVLGQVVLELRLSADERYRLGLVRLMPPGKVPYSATFSVPIAAEEAADAEVWLLIPDVHAEYRLGYVRDAMLAGTRTAMIVGFLDPSKVDMASAEPLATLAREAPKRHYEPPTLTELPKFLVNEAVEFQIVPPHGLWHSGVYVCAEEFGHRVQTQDGVFERVSMLAIRRKPAVGPLVG